MARLLNGERVGNRGESSADVVTAEYAVEVKSTIAGTPNWLTGAWNQALRAAAQTGLKPVVIRSHRDGQRRTYWWIERIDVDGTEEG